MLTIPMSKLPVSSDIYEEDKYGLLKEEPNFVLLTQDEADKLFTILKREPMEGNDQTR